MTNELCIRDIFDSNGEVIGFAMSGSSVPTPYTSPSPNDGSFDYLIGLEERKNKDALFVHDGGLDYDIRESPYRIPQCIYHKDGE